MTTALPLEQRNVVTGVPFQQTGFNILLNHRQPGESFIDYKARLRFAQRMVKTHLNGKFIHVSSRLVNCIAGDELNEAIRRGDLRDVFETGRLDEHGKMRCIARTKGVTYVRTDRHSRKVLRAARRGIV